MKPEISVFSIIRTKYHTLSKTQKVIADYVLANPEKVIMYTLNELSRAAGISEASAVRFLYKIEYESYQVFRVQVAKEIAKNEDNGSQGGVMAEINATDTVAEITEKVLQLIIRSIRDSRETINPASVERAVSMILGAKKIVWVGMGSSYAIALDGFHKLMKLGIDSIYLNDPHLINVICNQMTAEDLLIVVSHSGESREVLDAISLARAEHCPVLTITSYTHSSAARHSNCIILSSSLETRYRSDAMTSRLIQLAIIDILYVSLSLRKKDAFKEIQKSRVAVARNKT